jgi:hypothetical protein
VAFWEYRIFLLELLLVIIIRPCIFPLFINLSKQRCSSKFLIFLCGKVSASITNAVARVALSRARILWHAESQETAVRSVETSRINQPATQPNNPEDQNPHPQRCSNLKPQTSQTTVSCYIYHEMCCLVNHTTCFVLFSYLPTAAVVLIASVLSGFNGL